MTWTNRLVHEKSPYLLQHAHNPVDWYPWGEEAFARARAEDKPIFLSIGYAACHWCHVMERESFTDPTIAAMLNTHFVAIKVDREERPDVDGIYIQSLLRISGTAGWPASLFLLPDLRPFTGATYLPPRPSHGIPSFRQVLERVRTAWITNREGVEQSGAMLHESLMAAPEVAGPRPTRSGYERAVAALIDRHDPEFGGFGHGHKFPQVPMLELLLLGARDGLPAAREALGRTLRSIDDGGLQDHLGGGFHRYCVDRDWTVPHFEKMLYDNAQLLRLFARSSATWARFGDSHAARADIRVVRDTVSYLLTDLRDPSGAFWASEDADDPEGEGIFYTFSHAEARQALGPEPLPYGISGPGNFEHGRTVLTARAGRPARPVRERLLEFRNRRPRPPVDRKLVTAWNGLAIGALAEAGRLFGADEWIQAAVRAAEVVIAARGADGLLPRIIGGTAPPTLDDQAFVAEGLIDLYQALPFEPRWLDTAAAIATAAIEAFGDPMGGFYNSTARSDLIVRRKAIEDGAEPSGNGRMVEVIRRLVAYGALGRERIDRQLGWAGGIMNQYPLGTPELWSVARAEEVGPLLLVIAGSPDHPLTRQMLLTWNRTWRPQALLALVPPGSDLGVRFVALADKAADPDGRPLAYVCRGSHCLAPIRTAEELERVIAG